MSRPLYVVHSDAILTDPESEAANIRNLVCCQKVFGPLVPASEESVVYRDYFPSEQFSVDNVGAALSSLSSACQLRIDRGRLRIRIYKSGRRRYAWSQLAAASLCILLAVGTLVVSHLRT
jgi:hypothetical protein